MIVCLCRGVSDRVVRLAVVQGARTVGEIARACGAGDGCGTCHEELGRLAGEASGHSASGCRPLSVRNCIEVVDALVTTG